MKKPSMRNKICSITLRLSVILCLCLAMSLTFWPSMQATAAGTTGMITTLVVVLEIPFLIFCGDRIYNRMPILKWMWLGMLITGVRFVALSYVTNPVIILLTQLPAVALFACIEFFPVLYLSRSVDKEVLSTAQSVLQMVSFGLARIVGTSVGGFLAEMMSLGEVFRLNGWMLVAAAAVLFYPLVKKRRAA